jgi:transcriptional regulator of acetoin/glycerol metabolism
MAKHHESAFFLWQDRISALRCQAALIHTRGNQREAARLIGIDHTTLHKILRRNDQMLLTRAAAEGWQGDS